MTSSILSRRLHRSLRRRQQQVEDISSQAGQQFEKNLIQRFGRLIGVRRFVAVWLSLLILLTGTLIVQTRALSGYYQTLRPVPGGTFAEGILGDFTNANPLYATGSVDSAVAKLLFGSLFTYNDHNQLVGDLAQSWSVDGTGRVYSVNLRPHLTWQDGQPLTAADVAFTYKLIQNPDAQSPLQASWQGVQVAAQGPLNVNFTLPNKLAAFPYSLTNGIVPEHLLSSIPPVELRSAAFNTVNPIGSGPFAWRTIQVLGTSPDTRQEEIALTPFAHYHGGTPKLAGLVVRGFHNQGLLIKSFQSGELDGVAGLQTVPPELATRSETYSLPLTGAAYVFFKTSAGVLGDVTVRRALVQAVDTAKLNHGLGYPVLPVREPLLMHQLGFDAADAQLGFNPAAAAQALQASGWAIGPQGIRTKNNRSLSFKLYAADTPDNRYLTTTLGRAWRSIGVDAQVVLQDASDTQNTVTYHNYDALLYSVSIGVDPDVFVYWDSSQVDVGSPTRLNLSEYKSSVADAALEAGRTRSDPVLRAIKYKPFLSAWQTDAPALGLYQPRFLYLTREPIFGLGEHTINAATDRFNNVENWQIRQANVTD